MVESQFLDMCFTGGTAAVTAASISHKINDFLSKNILEANCTL